jgi:hypothetical protein
MTRKTSVSLFTLAFTLALGFMLLPEPAQAQFVYVANANGNNVSGYTINAATGALTAIAGSPFPAGTNPASVAVDSSGKFAYVANSGSALNDVSGYTINATTGAVTDIPGSPFFTAGLTPFLSPTPVVMDPLTRSAAATTLPTL